MKEFTFITGNQHKVKYLEKWLGTTVEHQSVDLPELQSLDTRVVIEHKAQLAYAIVGKPVLVEDVSLQFTAMGRLPGPFIKFFLEELGADGLIKLADGLAHRQAVASLIYGYYDGKELRTFTGSKKGTVATEQRGENSFGKGWNTIFIPDGATKTYAEMTDDEIRPFSHRAEAIETLQEFLHG